MSKFVYSTIGSADHGMTAGLPFSAQSGPGGALLSADLRGDPGFPAPMHPSSAAPAMHYAAPTPSPSSTVVDPSPSQASMEVNYIHVCCISPNVARMPSEREFLGRE